MDLPWKNAGSRLWGSVMAAPHGAGCSWKRSSRKASTSTRPCVGWPAVRRTRRRAATPGPSGVQPDAGQRSHSPNLPGNWRGPTGCLVRSEGKGLPSGPLTRCRRGRGRPYKYRYASRTVRPGWPQAGKVISTAIRPVNFGVRVRGPRQGLVPRPFAFQGTGRGPEAPASSQVSSKRLSYLTTMSPASQKSAVHPESRAVKRQRLAANVPTGVAICSSPMSS
jgi:hypothetical protein